MSIAPMMAKDAVSSHDIFEGFKIGQVIVVRLTTGEVGIALYQGSDGTMVKLLSPRILKLEKMHLVYTDFMMAGDARLPCSVVIAHITAVASPTSEAEEGYLSLVARLSETE